MRVLYATAAILLGTISVSRADDFSINLDPGFAGFVGIASDYIHRGDSQAFGQRLTIKLGQSQIGYVEPTLTAGGSYTLENGLFVSVSAITSDETNLSLPNGTNTPSSIFEDDVMVGWKTMLSDHWLYQTDMLLTAYPGISRFNFYSTEEWQNVVNYVTPWGKIVGAIAIEPQGQYRSGFYTYVSGGADYNVTDKLTLGGRVGYTTQAIHRVAPNYWDWTVTLTYNVTSHFQGTLQYLNSTNYSGNIYNTGNGSKIVAGLTYSF